MKELWSNPFGPTWRRYTGSLNPLCCDEDENIAVLLVDEEGETIARGVEGARFLPSKCFEERTKVHLELGEQRIVEIVDWATCSILKLEAELVDGQVKMHPVKAHDTLVSFLKTRETFTQETELFLFTPAVHETILFMMAFSSLLLLAMIVLAILNAPTMLNLGFATIRFNPFEIEVRAASKLVLGFGTIFLTWKVASKVIDRVFQKKEKDI